MNGLSLIVILSRGGATRSLSEQASAPLMQWRLIVARFDRGRRKKAQTIGLRRFDACRAVGRCRKFTGQTGEASGFARNNRDVLD